MGAAARTYLLIHVFSSVDADDGGDRLSLRRSHSVVKELRLHGRVVFDVWWLVPATIESLGTRGVGRLSIRLAVNIFWFDASDVAAVAYLIMQNSDG